MKREILNPRWADETKTRVWCNFKYEDGKLLTAVVSDTTEGNPDWKEIIETFGTETLDKNSEEFFKKAEEEKKVKEQREKERLEIAKNEVVFNAKLEAFSIDEVKNSKNTDLKSKIRRAKSSIEVAAYTAVLLSEELKTKTDE